MSLIVAVADAKSSAHSDVGPVSGAGLARLEALVNLRELRLINDAAVTDASLAHLKPLKNLANLVLQADDNSDHGAGMAGVEAGIVLGGSPRRVVRVGAEENGSRGRMIRRRAPDCACRGTKLENVFSPGILDLDRRVQALGLRPDVVLPGDAARFRLQGHDETATGETLVLGWSEVIALDGLSVAADAQVVLDGQKKQLGDLKPGMWITPKLGPGRTRIAKIVATSKDVDLYAVWSVNAEQSIIKVRLGGFGVDFPVAKDARIIVNNEQVKLADLQPGMHVALDLGVTDNRIAVKTIRGRR